MRHLLIIILCLNAFVLKAQKLEWHTLAYPGSNIHNNITYDGITIEMFTRDSKNNLIIIGTFGNNSNKIGTSLHFGHLNFNTKDILKTASYGHFIAKIDTNGRYVWAKPLEISRPSGYYIQVDEYDNIYFTFSHAPWRTDGFPLDKIKSDNSDTRDNHVQLVKLTKDGEIVWARNFLKKYWPEGFNSNPYYLRFSVIEDKVLINGYFHGFYANHLNPGEIQINDTTYRNQDPVNKIFIAIFDTSGKFKKIVFKNGDYTSNRNRNYWYHLNNLQGNNKNMILVNYLNDDNINYEKVDTTGKDLNSLIFNYTSTSNSYRYYYLAHQQDFDGNIYFYGNIFGTLSNKYQTISCDTCFVILKYDADFKPLWTKILKSDSGGLWGNYNNSYNNQIINKKNELNIFIHFLGKLIIDDSTYYSDPNYYNFLHITLNKHGNVVRNDLMLNSKHSYGNSSAYTFLDECGNTYLLANVFDTIRFKDLVVYRIDSIFTSAASISNFSKDNYRVNFNYSYLCTKNLQLQNASDSVYKYFRWLHEGKAIDSSYNLNYEFKKSGNYPITLLGIKENGCSNTFTDTVLYIKPPVAKYISDSSVGCQWVAFHFKDGIFRDTFNQNQNWQWNFGDGETLSYSNRKDTVSHVYTKEGTFLVRLIYSNGFCSDTFTQQQTVTILPSPKPGFTVSDSAGCAPLTVKVKYGQVGEVSAISYIVSDRRNSIDLNPEFEFKVPGFYTIEQQLLGPSGCITKHKQIIKIYKGFDATVKPEMLRATFEENNFLKIEWKENAQAENYDVYRKPASALQFFHIGKTQNFWFTDSSIQQHMLNVNSPFAYVINAIDSCGKNSLQSEVAQPVILQSNLHAVLYWSAYEKWNEGVEKYEIQQKTDTGFVTISSTNGFTFNALDILDVSKPEMCFRIKAVEKGGNLQESFSNSLCIPREPIIWMPNAFTPNVNDLNDYIHPVFYGVISFEFKIFNREGVKVFQTSELNNGWDGRFKGEVVPEGVFHYIITAKGYDGNEVVKKGNISVLR